MFRKRMVSALALGIGMAGPAAAEVQQGWYFGVSPGQATYDISKEELDEIVVDAFFANGAPVLTGTSSLEDSDTAWSILGGYRFNPFIAIEAGYIDLGAAEYRSSGTVNPPGPVLSAPATANIDFESAGFTLAGVGSLPLGDMFDLHSRIGIYFADTEISVGLTMDSVGARETLSGSSQDVFYGIGAGLHVGTNWSFSLDWQRYADVGDEDKTGEGDIDTLSLSLMYRL